MAEPPYGLSDDNRAEIEEAVRGLLDAAGRFGLDARDVSVETIANFALDYALNKGMVMVPLDREEDGWEPWMARPDGA